MFSSQSVPEEFAPLRPLRRPRHRAPTIRVPGTYMLRERIAFVLFLFLHVGRISCPPARPRDTHCIKRAPPYSDGGHVVAPSADASACTHAIARVKVQPPHNESACQPRLGHPRTAKGRQRPPGASATASKKNTEFQVPSKNSPLQPCGYSLQTFGPCASRSVAS